MALNKQSNIYTIVYIIVLVTVVGAGLAFTSMALKSRQTDNANADKMRQILASVHETAENGDIKAAYARFITGSLVVNSKGETVEGVDAFDVNVAKQSKLPDADRKLPVYICKTKGGDIKYILPVYGAGLWGPIWGYVSVNADGTGIYGAYFAHQGETPGLGAEIEKSKFANEFNGKSLWRGDVFTPTEVVKAGQRAADDPYSVDGVSGGTITSRGVSAMLHDCLMPYAAYLETLKNKKNDVKPSNTEE